MDKEAFDFWRWNKGWFASSEFPKQSLKSCFLLIKQLVIWHSTLFLSVVSVWWDHCWESELEKHTSFMSRFCINSQQNNKAARLCRRTISQVNRSSFCEVLRDHTSGFESLFGQTKPNNRNQYNVGLLRKSSITKHKRSILPAEYCVISFSWLVNWRHCTKSWTLELFLLQTQNCSGFARKLLCSSVLQ